MPLVGRITGLADCQWADPAMATTELDGVRLDREYALASGFLEITYNTGAKVILQGPCQYRVESSTGGFLALGKLTAWVERRESGTATQESGARGERTADLALLEHKTVPTTSLAPRPLPHQAEIGHPKSALFCVRTPTAIVSDLGTEFGVEVDESGETESHVFAGEVRVVCLGAAAGAEQATTLGAGQEARARRKGGIVVPATPGRADRFVRALRPDLANAGRIVERFDSGKLGAAFEQMPPGRYDIGNGAAVYRQPATSNGRQSRGYIRTVATDFCNRDFVFKATVVVQLEAPDLSHQSHWVFFGIGSGDLNADYYDEMTCGLTAAMVVDMGRVWVRRHCPDFSTTRDISREMLAADFTPSDVLTPGRHRLRMVKEGTRVQFAVDANYTGHFQADFSSPWIDLPAVMPLLNANNSRLVVGTGNCDTMKVRFEDLSITYAKRR